MLLNRPSLLSWYNSTTPSGYLPTPQIKNQCANSHLVWFEGDTLSFYINAHIPTIPTTFTLELVSTASGISNHSFSAPSVYVNDAAERFYYATITCPAKPIGTYYLQLTINSTVYKSGFIDIISATEAANQTVKLKFRNTFTKHKVYYPYSPLTTFYQQFRLRAAWLGSEHRLNKEVMRDSDSSKPREFNQEESFFRRLMFYQLDTNAIDGLAGAFGHDYMEINGKKYRSDGAINQGQFGKNGLTNIEVLVEDYELNYFTRV